MWENLLFIRIFIVIILFTVNNIFWLYYIWIERKPYSKEDYLIDNFICFLVYYLILF